MDVHGLAARYCVRQDARGFIELWGLLVALAAAAIAILRSARVKMGDRTQRRVALFSAGALGCLILFTCGFALTIFRWCHESAAPSLGMVLPDASGKNLDAMICLSPHVLEMIDGWILITVSSIAAIGLFALGIFQRKSAVRRALSFAGAGMALLFATANGGLMLFGVSWCQSQRLF